MQSGDPVYPIYAIDAAGFVWKHNDLNSALAYIEPTDITTDEYVGWDSECRELAFSLMKGHDVAIRRVVVERQRRDAVLERVKERAIEMGYGEEVATWPNSFLAALERSSDEKYKGVHPSRLGAFSRFISRVLKRWRRREPD